jgi:hypothetical protein
MRYLERHGYWTLVLFSRLSGQVFFPFCLAWISSRESYDALRDPKHAIKPMAYAHDQFGREWDAPCNSANDCEETNGLWVRRFRRGATKFQRRCLGNARNNERCRTKTHSLILLILEP